jgi:hypothetical protein
MEIYFVLYQPGYWRGFVTTNEALANQKLAENPIYRLEKTEIKPVDFAPTQATWSGTVGSYSATLELLNLQNWNCFLPVYNKNNKEHREWYQCVNNCDLPALAEGFEVHDPEYNFFGTVLYIRKD